MPSSVDRRWHELSHAAGLSGEDVGLNRFEPQHFYLLGGRLAAVPRGDGVSSVTAVRARVISEAAAASPSPPLPTLIRMLNNTYHPTRLSVIAPPGMDADILEVIAHDGRQFRDTSTPGGESRPLRDLGQPLRTSSLGFGSAERYEVLLVPRATPAAGQRYQLSVQWFHWVTGRPMAARTIPVTLIR